MSFDQSPKVDILCPSLWRPERMKWFAERIAAVTHIPYRLLFGLSADDYESIRVARELKAEVALTPRYSCNAKLNELARCVLAPWAVWLADRGELTDKWHVECSEIFDKNSSVQVIGIRNQIEPSTSSAFCFRRGYEGVIDCPGKLVNDAYEHEFADTEFKHTAIRRGVWANTERTFCLHHTARFGRHDFGSDKTTERAKERHEECRDLFMSRRLLWE